MKSVATKNICREPTSCRDNPGHVRRTLLCACPCLVMCAPRVLSPRAQSLSCQLCRHPTMPCRDTISMSRPKLSRDLEYQVVTWEPPPMTKLCCDNKPSYNDQPLLQHKTVCHDIELFNLDDLLSRQRKSYRGLGNPCQDPILSRHKTHSLDTVTTKDLKSCCNKESHVATFP